MEPEHAGDRRGRRPSLEMRTAMSVSKDLVAASTTSLILAILAEGDSYGYAIIKRVSELSRGQLRWTDGMLYPVLHRLERLGHVGAKWGASESGRRRKYYRITRKGRAYLIQQQREWTLVDTALRNLWTGLRIDANVRLAPVPQRS